jgi:hypothetical protein
MMSKRKTGICICVAVFGVASTVVVSRLFLEARGDNGQLRAFRSEEASTEENAPAAHDPRVQPAELPEPRSDREMLENVEHPETSTSQGREHGDRDSAPVMRDISTELSRLDRISSDINIPGDTESVQHAQSILKSVRFAWVECQALANSGKVKVVCSNGLYRAFYKPIGQSSAFSFTFSSEVGQVRQYKKWAIFPEAGQVGQSEYELLFYESGTPEFCVLSQTKEQVHFYPSGSVHRVYFETPDGYANTLIWHEDGSFDVHRRIKKADFSQVLRDTNNVGD